MDETKMLDMDSKTISDWIQWLILAVLSLVTWLRKPGEDAGKRVEALDADVRLLRERIEHLPTDDEMRGLGERMARLEATTEGQAITLKAIQRQTDRIADHLLNNS